MPAGIMMGGCSGTVEESTESAPVGSGTEVMQESAESAGGTESGTNHISEEVSDKLVIDAEVVLPEEQIYSACVCVDQKSVSVRRFGCFSECRKQW